MRLCEIEMVKNMFDARCRHKGEDKLAADVMESMGSPWCGKSGGKVQSMLSGPALLSMTRGAA